MDKFTKVVKTQNIQTQKDIDSVVYKGQYLNVIKQNENDFVSENDTIVCLVYIKDEGYILMRSEPVTGWQHKQKNDINKISGLFLTVISGTIEKGESPQGCLRRELYEEAGLVLNEFKQYDIEGPFYKTKSTDSQYYTCLLELNYNDYRMVAAPGDGSKKEKLSRTVKISVGDIDEIKCNDMVSKFLIDKIKTEYNL